MINTTSLRKAGLPACMFQFAMRFFVLLVALLPVTGFAQRAAPPHQGMWVHDDANVLSPQTKQQLEYLLKADRDSTSNQIAVLIISSLEGDDIDAYANRVFNEWKLGDEKRDNGVLLLIALQDKRIRIEVGQGLEGRLTDLTSSRINRNEIAPHFRAQDYDGGVRAGVLAIISAVKGEYVNDKPVGRKKRGNNGVLFTIFAVLAIIYMLSRRRGGGGGGGGYWSSGGGWIGPMGGFGSGRSSGGSSWGDSGSDFGGGGFSGGGGSSDSW